ncbi:MAG: hypothetical protein AB1778_08635 [Candidatus Bipolaricaulota bacterium]
MREEQRTSVSAWALAVILLGACATWAAVGDQLPEAPILGDISLRYVAPIVCDWNHDGQDDLVLCTRSGDIAILETASGIMDLAIRRAYYLVSVSSDGDGPRTRISASSSLTSPSIDVVDWTGDGALDVVAFDSNLALWVHPGVPERMDQLGSPIPVQFTDGTQVAFPRCVEWGANAAVRVLDWDDDGVQDLLVAVDECYLLRGSASFPEYERPADWNQASFCSTGNPARENLELFGLSGYGVIPWGVDWNRDGRLDVLIGYAANLPDRTLGRVLLAVNDGSNRRPRFDQADLPDDDLFLRTGSGQAVGCGTGATVAVWDVDRDGQWDALVGGSGPLALYLGNGTRTVQAVWVLDTVQAGG